MHRAVRALGFVCALCLAGLTAKASAATLYVADNTGTPTVRLLGPDFSYQGSFSVPNPITGLSAGPTGHVYVATDSAVYDYSSAGTVLNTLPSGGADHFADLSFDGTALFVADNSASPVVGMVAPNFFVFGAFVVPDPITGLSAGPSGHIFVSSDAAVHDYSSTGTVLNTVPSGGGDHFADLAFNGSTLFVADNSASPVVGMLAPNFFVLGAFVVPNAMTGLSIGPGGDVFVASDNFLYRYNSTGVLLGSFAGNSFDSFGDIAFTPDSVPFPPVPAAVPAPSTAALLIVGLLGTWRQRRRIAKLHA